MWISTTSRTRSYDRCVSSAAAWCSTPEHSVITAWSIDHDDGVLAAWRTAAPALLEAVLQLATTGLERSARPLAARCPRCQQRRGVQSLRKRGVQTCVGAISLKRWWHHCWPCGHGWSPPDQAL